MAFHPNFPNDARVYLVYTYLENGAIKERLVHYTYQNGALQDPQILINGIPGNTTHDGSRLVFGPDEKLYMTTGDAQNLTTPQDRSSLNGKVLRVNPDGSVPADNPFGSYVWSTGHRNAQGLYFKGDTLYSSEHGAATDDEVNIIEKAANYGWPEVQGYCNTPNEIQFCDDSNVVEPIQTWTPTVATSDILVYEHDAIAGLKGKLLLTTLKEQDLRVMELTSDGLGVSNESIYFNQWWGRLRDICVAPDGRLFIATNGFTWGEAGTFRHKIVEVRNPSVHGYQDLEKEGDKLHIYPNPSEGTPQLEYQGMSQNDTYQMLDASGKVIAQGSVKDFQQAALRAGSYAVRVKTADEVLVGRFVVR
jgi:glucose/arabinose dehydrogenase